MSGLPGKASGELLTQEPSPMLGKYHSDQEKLQQAWSFMGFLLHALVRKGVMVSGITSLLVTLVSPWRRDASSRQNLSDFTQPDVPSGGVLRLVPVRSSTEQSPSLFLLRTAEIG